MTTLTIIKDDKFVSVDGEGLTLATVVLPSNVHAVQFDGANGKIEYNDGTANEAITSISDYSTITDDHATLKSANTTAASDAATTQTALEATYGWKRQYDATNKYASVEDQLDQQYHDAVDSTTTWKDAIAVVKAAHPK